MKTMMLRDGDLVVSRRDYVMTTGAGKVAQDIRGALLEPLGNDRFHTGWGSTLDQFVGTVLNEFSEMDIEAEVNRVINNYAAIQRDRIDTDIISEAATPRFTTDEVLSRIDSIALTSDADTVNIVIRLRTVSGEIIVLKESIG